MQLKFVNTPEASSSKVLPNISLDWAYPANIHDRGQFFLGQMEPKDLENWTKRVHCGGCVGLGETKVLLTPLRRCQSALRWLHKSFWYPPRHFYQSTSSHSRTAWCLLQWSRGWNKCVSTQNGHSAYRRPNSPCKISLRYKIRKKSHSILNYPCPVQ